MKLYTTPPSILTLVTWVPQSAWPLATPYIDWTFLRTRLSTFLSKMSFNLTFTFLSVFFLVNLLF